MWPGTATLVPSTLSSQPAEESGANQRGTRSGLAVVLRPPTDMPANSLTALPRFRRPGCSRALRQTRQTLRPLRAGVIAKRAPPRPTPLLVGSALGLEDLFDRLGAVRKNLVELARHDGGMDQVAEHAKGQGVLHLVTHQGP